MSNILEFYSSQAMYLVAPRSDLLGEGMMAKVFRATWQDEPYALKLLTDPDLAGPFFAEADLLAAFAAAAPDCDLEIDARLLTPRLLDQQRRGDRQFFVMDLALGRPLDELLRGEPGCLPERDALAVAEQLCRLFHCLHAVLRRSHPDFRPGNVYWDENRRQIMVIDWNAVSEEGKADVAADLQALARLLYRLLTGAEARQGGLNEAPRWNELSLGTRRIVQRALHPQPEQRFASAGQLRQAVAGQLAAWNLSAGQMIQEAARLRAADGQAGEERREDLLWQTLAWLDLTNRAGEDPSPALASVRDNLHIAAQSELDRLVAERELAGVSEQVARQEARLEHLLAAVAQERQDLLDARQRLETIEEAIDSADALLRQLHADIAAAEDRKAGIDAEVEARYQEKWQHAEQRIKAQTEEQKKRLEHSLATRKAEIEKLQGILDDLLARRDAELKDLQVQRASLNQEIADLRAGKLELKPTTALTTILQREMEQMRTANQELAAQKAALEQEIANSRFRNQPGTATTPGAAADKSDGWQRLFEALKLTQTGLLYQVKHAIKEAEAVAVEAGKTGDKALEREATDLVRSWKPWHDRNSADWEKVDDGFIRQSPEVSLQTFHKLYRDGVRGVTHAGEIEKAQAGALDIAARAVADRASAGYRDLQMQQQDKERMRGYVRTAQELMQRSPGQNVQNEVRQLVGWIPDWYRSWAKATETRQQGELP